MDMERLGALPSGLVLFTVVEFDHRRNFNLIHPHIFPAPDPPHWIYLAYAIALYSRSVLCLAY